MFLSVNIPFFAQNDLFQKKEFVYNGDTLKYRVLFPNNYDKTQKYPLVVFLHGSGERGNDNEKQLTHGSVLFTDEKKQAGFSLHRHLSAMSEK